MYFGRMLVALITLLLVGMPPTYAFHNCGVAPGIWKVIDPGTEVVLWRGHAFEGFIYIHLQTDEGPGEGNFQVVDLATDAIVQTLKATEFATIGITAPETGVEIRVEFEGKTLCIPCTKVTDHKSAAEVARQWAKPEVAACGTDVECLQSVVPAEHHRHDSEFWPEGDA